MTRCTKPSQKGPYSLFLSLSFVQLSGGTPWTDMHALAQSISKSQKLSPLGLRSWALSDILSSLYISPCTFASQLSLPLLTSFIWRNSNNILVYVYSPLTLIQRTLVLTYMCISQWRSMMEMSRCWTLGSGQKPANQSICTKSPVHSSTNGPTFIPWTMDIYLPFVSVFALLLSQLSSPRMISRQPAP
jgi:hypothetical protein